ncbi:glycosyl hydrolase [Halobacillus salinarum]|uniref:Glycosyl hydrolase n=1 Tax=Halobacillus salinarum TaxID=2932257 RepID=A0ABY4EJE5_9BACI|nr:sialidase family protein [Halobacillus salinarum]UOQ44172.1 glycosyl hydrolase [Halobacillus salinarum]
MRKFFLGMQDELFIIEETDQGYNQYSRLEGTEPIRIAVDPGNKNRVYCATYGHGLWKSEDGGNSFHAIGQVNSYHEPMKGQGIKSAHLSAVAVHPYKKKNGNHIVYAGTEPSALYFSEDHGESWTEFKGVQNLPSKANWQFPPRPFTSHIRWITPGFVDENHLTASVEFGAVIRTANHGETWEDRSFLSPLDAHTILAHPERPGQLYAACGDGFMAAGHSYSESEDEGKTWTYKSEGLENHPYLYNMVLHSNDPEDRLVSAAESPLKAHQSSLYSTIYRKKGEQVWKEAAEGLPKEGAYIHTLAADPVENGIFYAMNNLGLFRLSAEDDRWERLSVQWKDKFTSQHPTSLVVTE